VTVGDVEQALSEALGPNYTVKVASTSTVTVGRTAVIPSRVELSWSEDGTTFRVSTAGILLSRIVQACSINPRVRIEGRDR